MRIVLDTNVLISYALWRGKCYELVRGLTRDPKCVVITSEPLVAELSDNL